jgi:hypothetical protein
VIGTDLPSVVDQLPGTGKSCNKSNNTTLKSRKKISRFESSDDDDDDDNDYHVS